MALMYSPSPREVADLAAHLFSSPSPIAMAGSRRSPSLPGPPPPPLSPISPIPPIPPKSAVCPADMSAAAAALFACAPPETLEHSPLRPFAELFAGIDAFALLERDTCPVPWSRASAACPRLAERARAERTIRAGPSADQSRVLIRRNAHTGEAEARVLYAGVARVLARLLSDLESDTPPPAHIALALSEYTRAGPVPGRADFALAGFNPARVLFAAEAAPGIFVSQHTVVTKVRGPGEHLPGLKHRRQMQVMAFWWRERLVLVLPSKWDQWPFLLDEEPVARLCRLAACLASLSREWQDLCADV